MYHRLASGGGCALVVVAILLDGAAGTARAEVLYGITRGNQLITVNPSTGAGTLVGVLSSNMIPPGLAFRGNTLYTYDQVAQRLRQLNPATAATIGTIDLGINIGFVGGDVTFASNGIGYLSAAGGAPGLFYRFDVRIPNATLISAALNPTMYGLAFSPSNVMYGLHDGGGPLYTINPATGATTLVGNTGVAGLIRGGMACDAHGQLFAAVGPVAGPSFLYKINASTGAATLVGSIGFNSVSGIAFVPPPPPSGTEGSFVASQGPSGQEGSFGLGVRSEARGGEDPSPSTSRLVPVLQGPFLLSADGRNHAPVYLAPGGGPPTDARLAVLHVAERQSTLASAGSAVTEGSKESLAWTLGVGLTLGALALLVAVKKQW